MKPKLLCIALASLGLAACTNTTDSNIRTPARELYNQAVIATEDQFYTEAEDLFTRLTDEHAGTRLATLAHLRLGELRFQRKQWDEAETSFRAFLLRNPQSHLTPHVLSRIIALNYERNLYGLLFPSRSFDRDMEPNRKIVQEYQRFYLLYRQSSYLEDVQELMLRARNDLAEYELIVGNYYFSQQAYNSAIERYLLLLRDYPEFARTTEVVRRLIDAYERNQQPEKANEMRRALQFNAALPT